MKVGLIDVDSHAKQKKFGATIYPNLAMCKIAAWHKQQGDTVEWYDAMWGGQYDVVYMSKIFNFSPDYDLPVYADRIIKGGTGYNITSKLPQEIDDMQPDYSIYPTVPDDTSYGFLTRGCPNTCPWCVVPKKEGKICKYWDIDRVANGRKKVVLMDNNILAAGDYAKEQLQKIIDRGYKVDFNQALDARLVTPEFAELLAQVSWLERRIRFGCDTPGQIDECERAMQLINSYGYKGQYFLYCMIGGKQRASETEHQAQARLFNEAYNRLTYWWLKNQEQREGHHTSRVYPHSQPYRDPEKPNFIIPQWQKDMAGWVNKKMIFEVVHFDEFEPRKGFKCSEYKKRYGT